MPQSTVINVGDALWYRDGFGLPTKMIVDTLTHGRRMIQGTNDRNAFVCGHVSLFSDTLHECESTFERIG